MTVRPAMRAVSVRGAAEQLTEEEIYERYAKRVRPLIQTHGAGSPRVAAVQARYGRMLERAQAARQVGGAR